MYEPGRGYARYFEAAESRDGQDERKTLLRSAAACFAASIARCTPLGADQSAAIRLLREALMTAISSIELEDDASARHFAECFGERPKTNETEPTT